jgi:hypothetical protein
VENALLFIETGQKAELPEAKPAVRSR